MKNNNSNKLLSIYLVKSITISIISVLVLSLSFSFALYKFDLDLKVIDVLSIIIVCISSAIVSFVSCIGFKNNGVLVGIFSCIPLYLYSVCTLIFGNNMLIYFVLKIILSICISSIIGFFTTKKSKRIKV